VRLGLFGGTFDPPHVGHLLAAIDACDHLALDRLLWVPAAQNPLKDTGPVAAAADRVAMVRAAVTADPRFAVETAEVERGGVSFAIDTVQAVQARHPGAALFLLVGEDVVPTLPQWRAVEALHAAATVAVLTRGSADAAPLPAGAVRVPTRRVDVSATEVRARVRAGRGIHGFVPDAVAAHIAAARLYL
jgi:nicotinate-nucleotide adenylyltransferase